MQKSAVAAIPLADEALVHWLTGKPGVSARPTIPFAPRVCDFLDELSKALSSDPRVASHPDLATFGFWCRKAHLLKLKSAYEDDAPRLGLGLAFHVAPANVPLTFAYSFAFGLLAGNANLVRVPSRNFEQVDLFCEVVSSLFKGAYRDLGATNAFVRYPADDSITERFSTTARARLIWGGDETIKSIRRFALADGGIDLSFRDRVSLCVLNAKSIAALGPQELKHLAQLFFNDSYFMDQNACSSPSLVVWVEGGHAQGKELFWNAVYEIAKKSYSMEPIQAVDKLVDLCRDAVGVESAKIRQHGNVLYRLEFPQLPPTLDDYRRRFGYFMEYDAKALTDLLPVLQTKCQTMTYYGVDKKALLDLVIKNGLGGVDRIVPIGSAFNMELVWDGYDLIRQLSRVIDVA
jgi:hypothetical protein